jgi:hypothetical protein
VSVVKPQSAFYERFGSRGIAVLERVIAESRAAGALVLLDVKRGDIGSTSQAYADAYLDPSSPLASDAITVSPYLGFGSLDPIIETAGRTRTGRTRRAAAVVVLTLLPLAAGCGGSRQEDYCAAVKEHQEALTEIVTGGGQDSLIRALDIFKDLQQVAPSDITDEWQQLVGRIETLDEALRAADVDPATYDRKSPPKGLSDEEKSRIDAAARELGSGATLGALAALDQQARDVCKTPLSL